MDRTQLKTNTNQLLNTGKETIKEVEKLTLETLGKASDRLGESRRKITHFAKENPILSALAVIGAGFLLAKIVRSKRPHV
jgi:hypothetical protein